MTPDHSNDLLELAKAEFNSNRESFRGLSEDEIATKLMADIRSRLQAQLSILDSTTFKTQLDQSARFYRQSFT